MAEVQLILDLETKRSKAALASFRKVTNTAFNRIEKSGTSAFRKLRSVGGVAFKGLGAAARRVGQSWRGVTLAITAGLAAVTVATVKAIGLANTQEDAEKALTAALGGRSQALLDQASALQQVTRFGDEAIIQQQAFLGSLKFTEDQIKSIIPVALDLSAATGISLESAVRNTAKTFSGLTGELGELIPQLRGLTAEQLMAGDAVQIMADLFGGQALAATETFSGAQEQLGNAAGDLGEEVGFVITKNKFLVDAMKLVTAQFQLAAQWVNNNRVFLMDLTKRGFGALIKGISGAVSVLKFLVNAWQGLKIVGSAALVAVSEQLELALKGLNALLFPFNKLFDALVKIGVMDTNILADAFTAGQQAVEQLQASTRDVLKETIDDTFRIGDGFDRAKQKVDELGASIANIKAGELVIPEAAAATLGAAPEAAIVPGAAGKLAELEKDDPFAKIGEAGPAEGLTPLEKLQADQQAELELLRSFAAEKLTLMQDSGAAEAEITQAGTEMKMQFADRVGQFEVDTRKATAQSLMQTAMSLLAFEAQHSKKAFQMHKMASIAKAIVAVHTGITRALDMPFPLNIAAAAQTAAVGFMNIKKIKSASFGGGGGGGSAGGGGGISGGGGGAAGGGSSVGGDLTMRPPEREAERAPQEFHVKIVNPIGDENWDDIAEDAMKAFSRASKRGVQMAKGTVEGREDD